MTGQVVQFVRALRQAGVRVSLAETLDACEALGHVDIRDRGEFRIAMEAVLLKDPRDRDTFHRLFDAYFGWHGLPRKRREPHRATHRNEGTAGRASGRAGEAESGRVGERESGRPNEQTPAKEQPAPEDRPLSHSPTLPFSHSPIPPLSHSLSLPLPLAALAGDLQEGMAEARRDAGRLATQQRAELLGLDLQRRLSPDDSRRVAAEVEKLARKLVSRESRRLRRARRGRLDLKATLARGVRTGGIPFHLVRRRHAIARQKLLVLCDVSGSVWNVAAFLLRLVHLLQNQFSRTHSLVFVDRPVDVTGLFQRYPFEDALARLRDHTDLNLNAYSDFGNVFFEVLDDHLPLLDRDTVLLVLGDARTNQFDPMPWALEEVRRRVRRIVWLNPEPPARWNTHDSALARYAPFCDALIPCGNLDQLAAAAHCLLRAA